MLPFALNHMTVARTGFVQLLDIAAALGCVGVEVRNDLALPLFDNMDPAQAGALARERGLRILSVAEVKAFDSWDSETQAQSLALIRTAHGAGAEAVSLIPRNDRTPPAGGKESTGLLSALRALQPMLEDHGLCGLIEPLGFPTCTLRSKTYAVEAIRTLDANQTFRLVHDTFHHCLAGEDRIFPEHTGLVHVSGVTHRDISPSAMTDGHRVLVDADDRLDNVGQLVSMLASGYRGPISFEAFADSVHDLADPVSALRESTEYLATRVSDCGN